jgi:hypothetical protein
MGANEQDYLYNAFIRYRKSDGSAIAALLRRRLQDAGIAQGRGNLRLYLETAFERANEVWLAN